MPLRLGIARRGSGPRTPSIRLSANSVTEGASADTVIGALSVAHHPSGPSGWTFAETADPDGKFNISSADLRTSGTWAYTPSTPSHQVTVTASKVGEDDLVRTFTVHVLAVLADLTADIPASLILGTADSGTITGAHDVNEVITITGPAGLTVDSAARTWAWSGVGSAASTTYQLTGTHPQATNSPHDTAAVGVDIEAAAGGSAGEPIGLLLSLLKAA